MKSLEQQMAFYAAYHRNPWNRLTHFIGVPVIIFAILVALSWLRFQVAGFEPTGAMVFAAIVLGYYFALDVPLALAMTAFVLPVLYVADLAARVSWQASLTLFLLTFVGGWIAQLVGHVFEGRKPALTANLF